MIRKSFIALVLPSGMVALPALSHAAPLAFQTAALANNPYVYFQQNDTASGTGLSLVDSSGNGRNGVFQGAPTTGLPGLPGLDSPSDNAIKYTGPASGAATQYFGVSGTGPTGLRDFGAALGKSSFEFVVKVNSPATNALQSLFGVFNTGNSTAVEVTLHSAGNDALGANATKTRLYIRGDNGVGIGADFSDAKLYDGNYHHLVFTFDSSLVTGSGVTLAGGFAAYLDGIQETMTLTQVASSPAGIPTNFNSFAFDPTFLARNVRGALGSSAVARQADVTLDEAALYTTVLSPSDVAAHVAALPEPSALCLLGFASVLVMNRRR